MSSAFRVGYATNVHPGRTLEQALGEIERCAPRVRERLVERGVLAPSETLELGAWFSAEAARALVERPGEVERTVDRLRALGLVIRSLNGFPYGHFHADRVQRAVYRPDWSAVDRLLHTESLAAILAECIRAEARHGALPPSARVEGLVGLGSISTVPVGWRSEILSGGAGAALGVATAHLRQLASSLARLEARTGVRIRVDLEPEPGCFLDRSSDVIEFFERHLAPRRGEVDPRRHLGVCHDVCHAAVMWEPQRPVLAHYAAAGITVGRVQLSSALEWRVPADAAALAAFDERRYLHQTTWRLADGAVRFFEDLPEALEASGGASPEDAITARTHLHVPLGSDRAGSLGTTRAEVTECLRSLPSPASTVLEVETYTWEVLPPALRPPTLAEGIAAEIEWVHSELDRLGRDRRPHAPAPSVAPGAPERRA